MFLKNFLRFFFGCLPYKQFKKKHRLQIRPVFIDYRLFNALDDAESILKVSGKITEQSWFTSSIQNVLKSQKTSYQYINISKHPAVHFQSWAHLHLKAERQGIQWQYCFVVMTITLFQAKVPDMIKLSQLEIFPPLNKFLRSLCGRENDDNNHANIHQILVGWNNQGSNFSGFRLGPLLAKCTSPTGAHFTLHVKCAPYLHKFTMGKIYTFYFELICGLSKQASPHNRPLICIVKLRGNSWSWKETKASASKKMHGICLHEIFVK